MTHRICPACEAPIPDDAPEGLCPTCLIAAGADEPEIVFSGGAETQRPPPSPEDIQKLFPHLEIVALIGQGGMGVVYEARQRGLNRKVALKLLWAPSNPDAEFEQRFAREGRALAQLSHPNIVTVHDAGQSGPYFWLVMEYVDGVDLRDLIRTGPIEPARALTIVMQMCAALDYAHKQGVVHRDIKPENVLVTRGGRVKIADFGLAKMLGRRYRNAALTRSEQTMGTPHYIAPEQIESPKEVDHRADIYSLGVVMYEVLTGELPIGRFLAPSHKVQVDVRLDEIVLKALQKQPERRYQKASEVSSAIRNVSAGRPAQARAPTARPARKLAPLHLGIAAVGALGLLWLTGSQLGLLGAEGEPEVLSAVEEFERGRQLALNPDTLRESIRHLEAAYAKDPALDGLASFYASRLRESSQRMTRQDLVDEALAAALKAREVEPSETNERFVQAAQRIAIDKWNTRLVLTSPKAGAVLGAGEILVQGRVVNFPPDAELQLAGRSIPVIDTFEERLMGLREGPHDLLSVRAPSGVTVPLGLRITIDTRAPELLLENLQPNQRVPGTFVVSGRVTDDTPTRIVIDGCEPVLLENGGPWSVEVELEAGERMLSVHAIDAAQNRETVEVPVVVDTTPPTIEAPRGFELAWSMAQADLFVRVSDEAGIGAVTWDGEELRLDQTGKARLPTSPTTREGVKSTHWLVATDVVGNTERFPFTLWRDETPPEIELAESDLVVFPGQTYTFRGSVEDRSPCSFVVDGPKGERGLLEAGAFEIPVAIPANAVAGETLERTIRFRDAAGNDKPVSRRLTVVAACTQCLAQDGHRGDCLDCSGTGSKQEPCTNGEDGQNRVKCQTCNGTGREECPTCDGTGKGDARDCDRCEEGRVECDTCHGRKENLEDCRKQCNGGYVYNTHNERRICNNCGGPPGKKYYPCVPCKGQGTRKCPVSHCDEGEIATKCPECVNGRSKTVNCAVCNGDKKVSETCSTCEGRGWKSKPCGTCQGSGKCTACGGKGHATSPAPATPR